MAIWIGALLLLGHSFFPHTHYSESLHQAAYAPKITSNSVLGLFEVLFSIDLGEGHLEKYLVNRGQEDATECPDLCPIPFLLAPEMHPALGIFDDFSIISPLPQEEQLSISDFFAYTHGLRAPPFHQHIGA